MRVRVSLDFDILIESFISLCIIETVGAIFREYKPWIVLLITQWSKSSKMLSLSLGLFDLQRSLTIHNTVHWSVRHTQSFRCLLIYPTKWDNWLLRCLFLTKKRQTTFLQTFGIPEISQTSLPILQKMQNIKMIYERNACQVRLKYTWLREILYR
jgi:hypothetical protein